MQSNYLVLRMFLPAFVILLAVAISTHPGVIYAAPTPIQTVFIILLENTEFNQAYVAAPYLTALANNYSYARSYFAAAHPSLPNYVAIIAGTTFGVNSNSPSTLNASNLVDLLEANNISWKAYMDSMPSACYTGSTYGPYAARHNPFTWFSDILNSPARCNKVVPLTQLFTDIQTRSIPQFVWITPDVNNDGHDTGVLYADNWLKSFLPNITSSYAYPQSAVFITFDEGTSSAGFGKLYGGNVLTVLMSPFAARGVASNANYSHYSLLATFEYLLGIGNLGRNDTLTSPMLDLFSFPAASRASGGGGSSIVSSTALSLNATAIKANGHLQINATTIPGFEGDFWINDFISRSILFQTHNKTIVWKPVRTGLFLLSAHPVGASVGQENATYLVVYGHDFAVSISNSTVKAGTSVILSGKDISDYNFMPWEDKFINIMYNNQTAKIPISDNKTFEFKLNLRVSSEIHIFYMGNLTGTFAVKVA